MLVELPSLREHQGDLIARCKKSLAKNGSVILCAGTGVGKTRCAKWILASYCNSPIKPDMSGHAMFAVHRRGLVTNASNSFNENPSLPHGIIMSKTRGNYDQRVQVASIDSFNDWFCAGGVYSSTQTYDICIYDETHSHLSKFQTFLKVHAEKRLELGLRPALVIGLSATPQAKGLSDTFGEIVFGPEKQWLIDNKFLKPYRYFRATQGKLDKLVVSSTGEFTDDSLDEAFSGLAGDLVRDWKKYANCQATVGFFPRLSHAIEATGVLRANGISCEYIDGKTPDIERETIFKMMRDGKLDYIANVGVVERGTDIPRIGCVQLCTSVGSLARFHQMVGRGSRPHDEVQECRVIDHGGNIKRHGYFEDDIPWCLDWTTRPDKEHTPRSSMPCPKCNETYRGGLCPYCGYEPTKKELLKEGLLFNGVELKEVHRTERKEPKKKSAESIWVDSLYSAAKSKRGNTLGNAYRIAKQECARRNVPFLIPKTFEVAGRKFTSFDQSDRSAWKEKVADAYPFVFKNFNPQDNRYMIRGR